MTDDKRIVDFDSAKEPLLHRRREDRVKKMRKAFKAAREAVAGQGEDKDSRHRSNKRSKKKKR
jgi:hypothetical protein